MSASPAPPIPLVDTDTAVWARATAYAVCPPHVAAHAERTFQFSALVARVERIEIDLELLYVATVLHDLGLDGHTVSDVRFEMRGANAVRTALLERGWERQRAETVWDMIALHASTAIAAHKSPETYVANRGISIDVRGQGHDLLDPTDVRAVLDAYPRAGFADAFAATMIAEVTANPSSARLSWLESIGVAAVPGFTAASFLGSLRSSSDFH